MFLYGVPMYGIRYYESSTFLPSMTQLLSVLVPDDFPADRPNATHPRPQRHRDQRMGSRKRSQCIIWGIPERIPHMFNLCYLLCGHDTEERRPTDRSARRAALRPSCCTQRWTLSQINWRPTTVASLSDRATLTPKLTTRVTIDVQLQHFESPEFLPKFQREMLLVLKIPEFL